MVSQYLLQSDLLYKQIQKQRCFIICIYLLHTHEVVIQKMGFNYSQLVDT